MYTLYPVRSNVSTKFAQNSMNCTATSSSSWAVGVPCEKPVPTGWSTQMTFVRRFHPYGFWTGANVPSCQRKGPFSWRRPSRDEHPGWRRDLVSHRRSPPVRGKKGSQTGEGDVRLHSARSRSHSQQQRWSRERTRRRAHPTSCWRAVSVRNKTRRRQNRHQEERCHRRGTLAHTGGYVSHVCTYVRLRHRQEVSKGRPGLN